MAETEGNPRRLHLKEIPGLFKAAFQAWREDKTATYGAALAYYAVFSLAPLLVIAIAVAGAFFGDEAARGQISSQISSLVGKDAAKAIEEIVRNAAKQGSGPIAAVIGTATLLLGASGVFGQLRETMNVIWEVEPTATGGLMQTIKNRFLSFAMIFGSCFLLAVSLLVSTVLSSLVELLPFGTGPLLFLADLLLSVAVLTLLFAGLFRFVPDAIVKWSDVWFGAFCTSLLFSVGKILIGLYLGRSGVASSYGAAGSIVLILLWANYAAQILFFGAEITKAFADRFGSRIRSSEEPKGVLSSPSSYS